MNYLTWKNMAWTLCAFALCACGGKKENSSATEAEEVSSKTEYPMLIPFESALNEKRPLKLSDIADSVRYIPLETTDASLIRRIKYGNIVKTSKYWLLPFLEDLFQFTSDGKFVRTIGAKGGGPGEFNWITGIDVNEAENHIYLMSTDNKTNVYDLESGKFLYAMKSNNSETQAFAMLDDKTAVSYIPNSNGSYPYQIRLTNAEGDTLQIFPRHDHFESPDGVPYSISSDNDRYLFHYDDLLCYKEYYNDTLYVVRPDKLEARYVLDLGKHSMPPEHRFEACGGDFKRFQNNAADYIRTQVFETKNYLFMPYIYWGDNEYNPHMMIYDKNKKECFEVEKGFIENDFGGMPFQPTTSVAPNVLVNFLNAERIFMYAEQEDASVLEHPQLKNLNEEDNPVLMVVYLKEK